MQTLLWDSRIRSLVVLLPAFGVLVWMASELASEEFIVPGVILTGFLALVTFTSFIQTVRVESICLCLLLTGYLVGNRGFADLTVAKPFYPGEFVLALILVCVLVRFALTRELPNFTGWIGFTILVFCALGAFRLLLDFNTYRMDAVRDSAMVYYSLYFFFGRQLAVRGQAMVVLERCLKFAFLALVPIAVIQRVDPLLLQTGAGKFTPFFQKDDLLTTFTAVAVFVLYTHPKFYRWNWLRVSLILFYFAYVVIGITRASLGGLIIGSLLLLIAGQRRFLIYPIIALMLGLTVLGGLAVTFGKSQTASTSVLTEKLASMVDFSGEHNYSSDYGDLKAGNNEWRRKLWTSFIDDTSVSPVFGRGFGFDFLASFEDKDVNEGNLRSAHNFFVTFYGRMGIVGILVFLTITAQIVVGGVRAALAVRAGWLPLASLSYWCSLWAILVAATVGVVLEGPVGAIVFWTFFGIAVETYTAASDKHRAAVHLRPSEFQVPHPLPTPVRRPALHGQVSLPS